MIRVMHIVGTMDVGGIERFIMNTYRNIDRSQVQFDFVVHNKEKNYYEDEINDLGGKIYRVESKSKNLFKNMWDMYKLFSINKQFKIIHIHTNSSTCITDLLIAKLCSIPNRIVHSHSTTTRDSKRKLHKMLRSLMNILTTKKFACSDLAARWLFGKSNYMNGQVTVINNAIESEKFRYNESISRKYRSDFNIEKSSLIIGHIGSLSNAKNHIFLIDIFKAILDKGVNAKLVIVGEGPFEITITKKIKELKLDDSVILTGLRDDIPNLLSLFDILVFPSFYEGFPVTLVEAQASGLPCIISDTITSQVKITELVQYVSLNEKANYWAEKTLSYRNEKRTDFTSQIVNHGFDIKKEATKLQEFYLHL